MILTSSAALALSSPALAAIPTEITWDDLIPPGIPYSEIIGEGQMNVETDTWLPVFDVNATKLNDALQGAYVKLPGYIIPIDYTSDGVTSFILVPYVGACIHTPPPPANQLIFVTLEKPFAHNNLWEPVWAIGTMRHEVQSTEVVVTGYALAAEKLEEYVWE